MKKSALNTINIIAAVFIFLFTYTAVSKLLNMEKFTTVLSSSSLIGSWAGFIAWSVILSEWVAVLLLLYPPLRLAGFCLTVLLMTAFTGYIAIMLATESRLPCSCGGVLKELSWRQHLYLNIFLLIAATAGVFLETKRRKRFRAVLL